MRRTSARASGRGRAPARRRRRAGRRPRRSAPLRRRRPRGRGWCSPGTGPRSRGARRDRGCGGRRLRAGCVPRGVPRAGSLASRRAGRAGGKPPQVRVRNGRSSPRFIPRGHSLKVFIALLLVVIGAVALTVFYFSHMPGQSPAPTTSAVSEDDRGASERIGEVCEAVAHEIGQRSTSKSANVVAARELLQAKLRKAGMHPVERPFSSRGNPGVNLEVELEGNNAKGEVVVLGAHYDSEPYSPGADDNASGCAMLLEIARELNGQSHNRAIDIVFFA